MKRVITALLAALLVSVAGGLRQRGRDKEAGGHLDVYDRCD